MHPYGSYTSPEEIGNIHRVNKNPPRRAEIKVRKNEMKLRKNQIISPKNFFVPRWRIKGIGRVTAVPQRTPRRVAKCRDARSCVRCIKGYSVCCRTARRVTAVGTHDLCVRCIKGYSVVVLTGTDAQTSNGCRDARSCVRCIKGYSVVVLTGTDTRPCVRS